MYFQFKNNIISGINELNQWHTYKNLLCGLPTAKLNQSILEDLADIAKRDFGISDIYVINPESQKVIHEIKDYPFGQVIRLPEITCMALISCFKDGKDELLLDNFEIPILHFQDIALVWFQDDFAFPIDENVLEKLKQTSWKDIITSITASLSYELSIEEKKNKITKKISHLKIQSERIKKRLDNQKYLAKAKWYHIPKEKSKKKQIETKIRILEESLKS